MRSKLLYGKLRQLLGSLPIIITSNFGSYHLTIFSLVLFPPIKMAIMKHTWAAAVGPNVLLSLKFFQGLLRLPYSQA